MNKKSGKKSKPFNNQTEFIEDKFNIANDKQYFMQSTKFHQPKTTKYARKRQKQSKWE